MISFVVLNWNSQDYLKRCIASICAQTNDDWELILVDNGSTNDSLKWLADWERTGVATEVLYLSDNKGYAAGMNIGIARTKGDIVVALNSDVALADNFVESITKCARAAPDGTGSFAVPTFVWNYAGGVRDELTDTLFSVGVALLRRLSVGEWHPAYDKRVALLGPDGGTQVFTRAALDAAHRLTGYFYDEDFHSYGEDIDMYVRQWLLGYRCQPCYATRVWHIGSASTGVVAFRKKPLRLQRMAQMNRLRVFRKLPRTMQTWSMLPLIVFDDLLRVLTVPAGFKVAREFARNYMSILSMHVPRYPHGTFRFAGTFFSRTRAFKQLGVRPRQPDASEG